MMESTTTGSKSLVNDVKHFKYIKLGQVKLVSHRIRQILTRTTKWRHPVSYVKSNGPNLPFQSENIYELLSSTKKMFFHQVERFHPRNSE